MAEKEFSVLNDDEPMEFNAAPSKETYKPEVAASPQHTSKLEQKRVEKEKHENEDSPNEKREVVMNGAQLKCQYAQGPGTLVVTSNEIKLQDQLWATKGDGNNMVNLQFKGTCGHPKWSGQTPPPCMSVINLSPWQNRGTGIVQEQTVLVKESYITCDPTPNAAVAKPIPQAESIKTNIDDMDIVPKVLDAYFAKWTSEKGEPKEIDVEVYDKKSKKNIPGKKKIDTKRITTEKITERGLSYQAALVIETIGLSGKTLKVKIKSGKKKVLSDVDTEIKLIDMKDIDAIKEVSKYKDVKAKAEFEVVVDELFNDVKTSNAADFKNKAVIHLMLNQKTDDLSFDLAEMINADADKSALLYIEVESTEPKVEFEGQGEKKNTFLNEEGKYFTIKYYEQPWIVKAREEQKLGVNETSNCSKIVDEYHKINRQNKPKECADTANSSWCASFVGWCLVNSGFSAQLDPGAYTYGKENTRYRAGFKRNPTDKKALVAEEWGDPVWGKLNSGNKVTLGAVCVLLGGHHVSMAVGKSSDGETIYYLGGNQGDSVCVGTFGNRLSCIYPVEYIKKDEDNELPIYYRKNEKISY